MIQVFSFIFFTITVIVNIFLNCEMKKMKIPKGPKGMDEF